VSGAYRSFAYRIDLDVPVERVWRAFTDSRVLARWAASGATITPREKGRMHVVFGGDVELDGHIDVLVTAQRLRLMLLPTPGMPVSEKGGADAVIVEDFLFERGKDGTTLRLLSSGVPSSQGWVTYYLNKRRYWELALTRLKVFLEKGLDQEQPGPRY
jgi:uncharacterized protein YndB with AHSA1/START domain